MTYTDFDSDGLADEFAFAFALFLVLVTLFEAVKSLTATGSEPAPRTRQSVTLNEDALQRLEDGEPVTVQRWHGGDLELTGAQVIDVETVDDEPED